MPGGFKVRASNGVALAWVYAVEGFTRAATPESLTFPEALAIAQAIARLAEKDR